MNASRCIGIKRLQKVSKVITLQSESKLEIESSPSCPVKEVGQYRDKERKKRRQMLRKKEKDKIKITGDLSYCRQQCRSSECFPCNWLCSNELCTLQTIQIDFCIRHMQ